MTREKEFSIALPGAYPIDPNTMKGAFTVMLNDATVSLLEWPFCKILSFYGDSWGYYE